MKQTKTASLHKLPPGKRGEELEPDDTVMCLEEAGLIEKAKTDSASFDLLYQRYVLRVYHYLRLRCPTEEDAADLTQHVFVLALEALPRYQNRNLPFAAWLFRIARNAITDNYRHDQATIAFEFLPQSLQPLSSESHDPEVMILRKERSDQLIQLLTKLSPATRELLALRFAIGLSVSEIALVVGKKEWAVRKQLARLVIKLRRQYEEQYP